jgi:TolB protein
MMPRDDIPTLEPRFPRPLRRLLIGGVLLGGLLTALFAWPLLGDAVLAPSLGQAAGLAFTATATPFQTSATPTLTPTAQPSATATLAAPLEAGGGHALDGLIVLSFFSEQGYAQLFSHQLLGEPFTRLTSGAWDDIDPALSADGSKLAFASNRGGNWDIYMLDLQTGRTELLSDDDAYDGYPSWSADGAWLAYAHYQNNNLEIMMRPVDGSLDPVNLSADGARDYAPAWRPGTQQIAFVSDRSGQPAIWLVDLEKDGAQRFRQLTASGEGQSSPAWSPDGAMLAWAAKEQNVWRIYAQDMQNKNAKPILIGFGEDPQWAPSGGVILATVRTTSASYLTGYALDGGLALAPELLRGRFEGAAWSAGALPDPLPAVLQAAAAATPSAAWADALADDVQHTTDRLSVVNLHSVTAPFAQINEVAAEPFDALRERAAQLLGWDALSNLEYVFVPNTEPLPPDRQQDWLYTGRAFSLQSNLLGAGWMAAVREEYDGQTYWHIYLRSAREDGGQGRPLTALPWNFAARYNGSESNYQAGGKLAADIPEGYWIDFTALAADYGFERLPAHSNWRSYFPGALFNEFALSAGLTWQEAMLQLYSPETVSTMEAMGQ